MKIKTAYGVKSLKLYPYQQATIDRIEDTHYNAILSCRQFGKDFTATYLSITRLHKGESTWYITPNVRMHQSIANGIVDESIDINKHSLCNDKAKVSFYDASRLYRLLVGDEDTFNELLSEVQHIVLSEAAFFSNHHFEHLLNAFLDSDVTITIFTTPSRFRGSAFDLYKNDNMFQKTYWRRFLHPDATYESLHEFRKYYENLLGKERYRSEFLLHW